LVVETDIDGRSGFREKSLILWATGGLDLRPGAAPSTIFVIFRRIFNKFVDN